MKKEAWLIKRAQELLPVPYYHVVFTLPNELNILCANHPRMMYNILFRSGWESLNEMMQSSRWCGGQTGALSVLHTWGQNLMLHPHIHCIVPAGGLDTKNNRWKPCKKSSVLVDVKELSRLFRKTFKRRLRTYWEFEEINFHGEAMKYEDINEWRKLFECFEKDWVVYSKAPNAGPSQTLNYLSRYTHSIAISEGRIEKISEESIHFIYKDYRDKDAQGIPKKKPMSLSPMVFLSRFALHILPSNFTKIRYFGIWAATNRKSKLRLCQQLLGYKPLLLTMQLLKALLKQKLGIDPACCQHCGSDQIVHFVLSPNGERTIKPIPDFKNRPPPKNKITKAA